MTILCVAMGDPVPTISLYIAGHLVISEVGRHLITNIQNVTKDMERISCLASNGFGVPMQAEKKINIACKFNDCFEQTAFYIYRII